MCLLSFHVLFRSAPLACGGPNIECQESRQAWCLLGKAREGLRSLGRFEGSVPEGALNLLEVASVWDSPQALKRL